MTCQSQSNPPNWIAICIEQSIKQSQQHPAVMRVDKTRLRQGTYNTIGSKLFCFRKSKQMNCLPEGWIK